MKAGLRLAFGRQGPLLETHKLGRVKPGGETFADGYCIIFSATKPSGFFQRRI